MLVDEDGAPLTKQLLAHPHHRYVRKKAAIGRRRSRCALPGAPVVVARRTSATGAIHYGTVSS